MIFSSTKLQGVYVIDLERFSDGRGFFAQAWSKRDFEARGLVADFVQANLAHTHRRGTIRGLHWQAPPFGQVKLVRCIAGQVYDVIVDLRPASPTYLQSMGILLSADNGSMVYVPDGFAHGYQTLADDSAVLYQVSQVYAPQYERGVRWDDPAISVVWPLGRPTVVSQRDQNWADLECPALVSD